MPVAIGPQMLNTTFGGELGNGGLPVPEPLTTMWSVTDVPGETEVDDGAVSAVALHGWNERRTKSLRVAVGEVDDRLSPSNDEKHSLPMPSLLRLMPAS